MNRPPSVSLVAQSALLLAAIAVGSVAAFFGATSLVDASPLAGLLASGVAGVVGGSKLLMAKFTRPALPESPHLPTVFTVATAMNLVGIVFWVTWMARHAQPGFVT